MKESALNVKIETVLKNRAKIKALEENLTLREFVEIAIREKVERCCDEIDTRNS